MARETRSPSSAPCPSSKRASTLHLCPPPPSSLRGCRRSPVVAAGVSGSDPGRKTRSRRTQSSRSSANDPRSSSVDTRSWDGEDGSSRRSSTSRKHTIDPEHRLVISTIDDPPEPDKDPARDRDFVGGAAAQPFLEGDVGTLPPLLLLLLLLLPLLNTDNSRPTRKVETVSTRGPSGRRPPPPSRTEAASPATATPYPSAPAESSVIVRAAIVVVHLARVSRALVSAGPMALLRSKCRT
ncbi:unnamed protein product [Ectocarpus sp. 12 AP-2014]